MLPRRLAAAFRASAARTRRVRGAGLAGKIGRRWITTSPHPGRDGLLFGARAQGQKICRGSKTTATHAHMGPVRHILPRDYPLPGRRRGPTPPATHLITLRVRARALVVAGLHHLLLVVGGSSWSWAGGRTSASWAGGRARWRSRASSPASRARAPAARPPTRSRRRAARSPARGGCFAHGSGVAYRRSENVSSYL